jgi:tetratricopeptide (TPR) repeat protein
MRHDAVTVGAALVLVVALMAAAIQVQAARERTYPPSGEEEATVYITSPAAVRRMSLAYPTLTADLYWIRALQYYGGTKRRVASEWPQLAPPFALAADPDAGYPLLYPLLDLTTSLDPRFNVAYRFGAIFLAEPYPGGPGRPDLAIALLEKGLRERPDKWEYMLDTGFVHYWFTQDYRAAADWFDQAARAPGAPWWLKPLAATTLAQGGDRRSSRQMWTAIRQSAENDWLKREADRRLAQLRALDEIDRLQQAIETVARRTGARPADWPSLIRAGVIPGVPLDPVGTPYEIASDGVVRLSPTSALFPLPEEPQAIRRPPA